jgi:hypothetical protein
MLAKKLCVSEPVNKGKELILNKYLYALNRVYHRNYLKTMIFNLTLNITS